MINHFARHDPVLFKPILYSNNFAIMVFFVSGWFILDTKPIKRVVLADPCWAYGCVNYFLHKLILNYWATNVKMWDSRQSRDSRNSKQFRDSRQFRNSGHFRQAWDFRRPDFLASFGYYQFITVYLDRVMYCSFFYFPYIFSDSVVISVSSNFP